MYKFYKNHEQHIPKILDGLHMDSFGDLLICPFSKNNNIFIINKIGEYVSGTTSWIHTIDQRNNVQNDENFEHYGWLLKIFLPSKTHNIKVLKEFFNGYIKMYGYNNDYLSKKYLKFYNHAIEKYIIPHTQQSTYNFFYIKQAISRNDSLWKGTYISTNMVKILSVAMQKGACASIIKFLINDLGIKFHDIDGIAKFLCGMSTFIVTCYPINSIVLFLSMHMDIISTHLQLTLSSVLDHWIECVNWYYCSNNDQYTNVVRLLIFLGATTKKYMVTVFEDFYNHFKDRRNMSLLSLMWIELMFKGQCSIRFEGDNVIYC